jgi:ornithine cyclodeaminase/alanine dehydrogenase-like protein (mu-crystallin family)
VQPLERAYALDTDPQVARRFAEEMSACLALDVRPGRPPTLRGRATFCVSCTPSRTPLLGREDVTAGTFIAAVGADHEDKVEIDPALMAAGTIVVDSLEQCATIGDLHHALTRGALTAAAVRATLADVVAGRKPGPDVGRGDRDLRQHRGGDRGRGRRGGGLREGHRRRTRRHHRSGRLNPGQPPPPGSAAC